MKAIKVLLILVVFIFGTQSVFANTATNNKNKNANSKSQKQGSSKNKSTTKKQPVKKTQPKPKSAIVKEKPQAEKPKPVETIPVSVDEDGNVQLLDSVPKDAKVLEEIQVVEQKPLEVKAKPKFASIVMMSDFGLRNPKVPAMKGIANIVSPNLEVVDLTHIIDVGDVWTGSVFLNQTVSSWAKETVFVSFVGAENYSGEIVVAKTRTGHYFVNPDNGLLTIIDDVFGVEEIRNISNILNSPKFNNPNFKLDNYNTYAYVASLLAAKKISFVEIGEVLPISNMKKLKYTKPELLANILYGNVVSIDNIDYGVYTNISKDLISRLDLKNNKVYRVVISKNNQLVYEGLIVYYDKAPAAGAYLYLNQDSMLSIAMVGNDFANFYDIGYGEGWSVNISNISN
jgi:S-adenosylmethionine hydrolase